MRLITAVVWKTTYIRDPRVRGCARGAEAPMTHPSPDDVIFPCVLIR